MKQRFINAYMRNYGTTKKEAMQTYKTLDNDFITAIIDVYENNAKKSFYND